MYRYTIHARHHLNAKAFCYLRTLTLKPPLIGDSFDHIFFMYNSLSWPADTGQASHSIHRFLYLSAECCVLIKQSYILFNASSTILDFFKLLEPSLSLSYSSLFAEFLLDYYPFYAFVFSTSLLVSDSRYGYSFLTKFSCTPFTKCRF